MVSCPSNQSSGRRGWIMLIDQGDDVDEECDGDGDGDDDNGGDDDGDGGDAIWSK